MQAVEQPEQQMAVDISSMENGAPQQPEVDSVSIEELERELPHVDDGQIDLSDVLSRVVQAIYAELTEMAETLPSMSDAVRKRTLADWVVKTKKQVVKLYAVAKWSRDAGTIQKCMNITSFIGAHHRQLEFSADFLQRLKDDLGRVRLRNHDLLTSLDVLTTGSYLRLPTCIKKRVTQPIPLTDEEVAKTLKDMENAILYRLRMSEIIPVEMSRYRIEDGRVFFTVPKLFEVSICLTGPLPTDGWFFVHVEFPINLKDETTGLQEFPRVPTGWAKQFISQEADNRLGYYLLAETETGRPKLPDGFVDTPLIRLYNFLARTPEQIVLARVQQRVKLGNTKPSDEVQPLRLSVTWEPSQGVLAVNLPPSELTLPRDELTVDADNLDFESMLRKVIEKHSRALLVALRAKLQQDSRGEFSEPGVVVAEKDALHLHLCTDEVVTMNVDMRSGRLNFKDINDLGVAGRASRFYVVTLRVFNNPEALVDHLGALRTRTILSIAEEKAHYLGYQSHRTRNLGKQVLEDIAFLDFERIRASRQGPDFGNTSNVSVQGLSLYDFKDWEANDTGASSGFDLTIQTMKELYSYCCARVAYMNVERQFKSRTIPYTHVNPASGTTQPTEIVRIQSSLARCVPSLCVQATDILSGAPAAEAAMPNIRVIPLNWWSDENAQVITCVKLKYVQQPLGKRAGSSTIIRPSKRIIYDTTEAVVSFLSENVNTCVDEFLEEWARVSKMVVIAREVAKMSKEKAWSDIQLLSFDLQTVEFAYAPGYAVSIACEDQLSLDGTKFILRFTRDDPADSFNPHDDAEPFLTSILQQHGQGRLAPSLERLVMMLRDTLPIAVELEKIRKGCQEQGYHVDTFAKASGWYRLLYPTLKHALDFRLLKNQRVAILDGSHSLFKPSHVRVDSGSVPQPSTSRTASSSSSSLGAASSSSGSASNAAAATNELFLQPIPQFSQFAKEAVSEAAQAGTPNLVDITVGVICETSAVGVLAQSIHKKVVEKLKR
ncbi:hypothetical protein EST38_g10430 [Candolleomyces aberdarensis]|uniref:Mediator of RNA polymerase II transcription subunit 14 n=1 Tax=Candolleomyces aberdarensis TaxID=2316362 RepID=A0A4Q2D7E6_9AGAR|nr:hypothetical protein EST38_g10430 [Candolleomyces aberdarensis]